MFHTDDRDVASLSVDLKDARCWYTLPDGTCVTGLHFDAAVLDNWLTAAGAALTDERGQKAAQDLLEVIQNCRQGSIPGRQIGEFILVSETSKIWPSQPAPWKLAMFGFWAVVWLAGLLWRVRTGRVGTE